VPPLPLQKDLLKQVLFNLPRMPVEAMNAGGHLKFTRGWSMWTASARSKSKWPTPAPVCRRCGDTAVRAGVSEKGGDHAGLGLSISRSLVERMNGQLSCASTPQGTHFLIRLPTLQQGQAPLMTNTLRPM